MAENYPRLGRSACPVPMDANPEEECVGPVEKAGQLPDVAQMQQVGGSDAT